MRKWFLGAAALLVAYPYLTLFWLDRAVLTGNTASLENLIDWPLVRQQLKADVKLALIQSAQTQVGKRNFAGFSVARSPPSWRRRWSTAPWTNGSPLRSS